MNRLTLKSVASLTMAWGLVFATLSDAGAAKNGGGQWRKNHPAMHKDNQTEKVEGSEIKHDVKDGSLTTAEGKADMEKVKDIHQQERADAAANGGHLTAADQKQITGELKGVQGGIKSQGGDTVNVKKAVARRDWVQNHPAMHADNQTERVEAKELRHDVNNGSLTKAQAQQEMSQIKNIHQEERADAAANGGHLTAAEQSQIKGQLQGVQGTIKSDGGNTVPVRQVVFDKDHPRAARDLQHVHRDEGALKQELASGKIDQATYDKEMAGLHTDAKVIRSDVRDDGHISNAEQSQIRKHVGEDTQEIKNQNTPPTPTPVVPAAPAPAAAQ